MTAEVERRGMVRPISDLPALVGNPDWLEVEQEVAGAPQFFKATQAQVGGAPNSVDIWSETVMQLPFAVDFSDVGPLELGVNASGAVAITGGVAVFSGAGGEIDYTSALAFGASAFDLGAPFTIEGWFKTNVATQFATLMERSFGGASQWELLINNGGANDGKLALYSPDGSPAVATTGKWNDNAWHHARVVKYWNQYMLWVDGLLNGYTVISPGGSWPIAATTVRVGASSTAGRAFIGSMHDWRVVKGIALSTVPKFAVPSFPFPTS